MQTHREAEDETEDEFDFPFALPSRRSVREALGVQRRAPNYEVLSPAHAPQSHPRLAPTRPTPAAPRLKTARCFIAMSSSRSRAWAATRVLWARMSATTAAFGSAASTGLVEVRLTVRQLLTF